MFIIGLADQALAIPKLKPPSNKSLVTLPLAKNLVASRPAPIAPEVIFLVTLSAIHIGDSGACQPILGACLTAALANPFNPIAFNALVNPSLANVPGPGTNPINPNRCPILPAISSATLLDLVSVQSLTGSVLNPSNAPTTKFCTVLIKLNSPLW